MKNPFLLIAGNHYYPNSRTDDWIKCFQTYDLAEKYVITIQEKNTREYYKIGGIEYDWYEIVDLREWTEND
jgi:hypothetical protein